MTPLITKMIGGGAILGAAAVWAPQLVSGQLSGDDAAPAAIPVSSYDDGSTAQGSEVGEPEPFSLDSLKPVLEFLEKRSREAKTAQSEPVVDAPPRVSEAPANPPELKRATEPEAEPESSAEEEQDFPELRAYLVESPLNALVVGGAHTSALFGRHTVRVGDRVLGDTVEILEINERGVLMRTQEGDVLLSTERYGGQLVSTDPTREPR